MRSQWILAVALATGLATTAHAGLIPAAVNVSNVGPNFRFQYSVVLPSDYVVKDGDFFTIYDFSGLQAGTNLQPAGWSFGSSMLGMNPPHIAPTDNAGLPNLTWIYHGPDLAGPSALGAFSADSTFGGQTVGDFASQDHNSFDGHAVGNITSTSVPNPSRDTPEPASMALLALGLPALGLWRLLRSRA